MSIHYYLQVLKVLITARPSAFKLEYLNNETFSF